MNRNIELKANANDLERLARAALAAGGVDHGVLIQHDTFYAVPTGRLKLRRIDGDRAELIFYRRADVAAEKTSDYLIARVTDAAAMHATLAAALGTVVDVSKRRRLLIWRNVRIHLDEVDGLGQFVELEAVVDDQMDEQTSRRNLAEARRFLEINGGALIDVAYADMLAPSGGQPRASVRAAASRTLPD